MGLNRFKLIFVFFVFFMLDLIRPLDFYFLAEFLFLGVIFVSLRAPLKFSLPFVFAFGVLKDLFSINTFPFYTAVFVFINIFTQQLLDYFSTKTLLRKILVVSAILVYTFLNSLQIGQIPLHLSFIFVTQSLFIFYAIEYFLSLWIPDLS